MTRTCDKCRNLVFHHVEDGTYRADFHPNLASLSETAGRRECDFCVVVQGMIEHYARWPADLHREDFPLYPSEDAVDVYLFFNQQTEDLDDWDYVEDESKWKGIEEAMTVNHPHGRIDFRVRSLDILTEGDCQGKKVLEESQMCVAEESDCESNNSTGSDVSMAQAASWINMCRTTHESCRILAHKTDKFPTRLLDVSNATGPVGSVRLVELERNSALSYVTLSHRWDPKNICMTTTSNVKVIINDGFLVKDLSPTFAHACITTSKLGFRFIWIDSLCIIQDLDSDKAQEIPNMADYYQNAELNIAASTYGKDGLWRERTGKATRPFKLDIKLEDDQGTRIAILHAAPILRGQKSHLDHRAWVLQERIFSRRTLFFDPYWIAFECNHISASESCPEGILNSAVSAVRLPILLGTELSRDCSLSLMGGMIRNQTPLKAGGDMATLMSEKEMLNLWYRIVEEYSLRQLTFESDQLDAVSGLAARMANILNDDYIGGIWRRDILRGLQWHTSRWRNKPVAYRQAEYRAPTWSWASTIVRRSEDAIRSELVSPSGFSNDAEGSHPLVSVIDVKWQCHDTNPYGRLRMARLTLSGRPVRSFIYYSEEGPDVDRDLITVDENLTGLPRLAVNRANESISPEKRAWYGSQKFYIHICGRTVSGEKATLILFLEPDTCQQENEGWRYVLPLADRNLFGSGATTKQSDLFCLVLREITNGVFERIGVARSQVQYMMEVQERQLVLV